MLDKFVGQVIRIVTYNDSMSLIAVGTLAAVVGENSYMLRVRGSDMTLRFRVAELEDVIKLDIPVISFKTEPLGS